LQESPGWSLRQEGAYAPEIFRVIEDILRPHLEAAYPARDLRRLDSHLREAFALKLPYKVQSEVRDAVKPIADTWISRRMAEMASKIAVGKLLSLPQL